MSVPSAESCLEQQIFIILAQIFKQSVRNKSAVIEHSESNQRAISEHHNKSQYRRSLKYCVLFLHIFLPQRILYFSKYFPERDMSKARKRSSSRGSSRSRSDQKETKQVHLQDCEHLIR